FGAVAQETGVVDEVDAEGAIAPVLLAFAAELPLDGVQLLHQFLGRQCAARDNDGVLVARRRLVDAVRLSCRGLTDPRGAHPAHTVERVDRAHGIARRAFSVAEVAAERDDSRKRDATPHRRPRVMVTETSSNG